MLSSISRLRAAAGMAVPPVSPVMSELSGYMSEARSRALPDEALLKIGLEVNLTSHGTVLDLFVGAAMLIFISEAFSGVGDRRRRLCEISGVSCDVSLRTRS
jgi:hypothetical protein